MNDIPEEIRKMFPNEPIHLIDVDKNGDLQILASAEPLSREPDFDNASIEQINQYLREHGYDPEQVGIRGKILIDTLIENINLKVRAEAAEAENKRLLAMLKHIYEPARIAASQIVCLGGEETCQPCENRESLLTVLAEVETELKGGEE